MDRIERAAQAICLTRFGHLRGYRKHKSIANQYRREAEAAIKAAGEVVIRPAKTVNSATIAGFEAIAPRLKP